MVRPKGAKSNCERDLTAEWQTLEKLASSDLDEQSTSDIAGDLLGTLSDWNDFLENHAPRYSGGDPENREPGL